MRNDDERPAYAIESVDKALTLLLLFRDHAFVRVSEASAHLGVARSTAHRLLAMLTYHGFVRRDPELRVYRAGPNLVDVGLAAIKDMDIRKLGEPMIERLSRQVDETTHIAVRDGSDVLFVAGVEASQVLRVGDRIGQRLPLHCTASGKAILAHMVPEEVRRVLPERLEKATPNSITRWHDLDADLERARANGYATNFGESEADLVAVAAAVIDAAGRVHGAVVVTGPAVRADQAWVDEVAPPTVETASELGAALH